jgi:S1-C subfamily serine protease/peroxiredoxin
VAAGSAGASLLVCLLCWFFFLKPASPQPGPPNSPQARAETIPTRAAPSASDNGAAKLPRTAGVAIAKSSQGTPSESGMSANKSHGRAAELQEEKPQSVASTTVSAPTGAILSQPPAKTKTDVQKAPTPARTDLSALPLEELIARVGDGVVLIKVLDQAGKPTGLGSGFVIDERGLVATCFHVIRHARQVQVQFRDGFTTEVKGSLQLSPQADLAILELKQKPNRLTVLRLAVDEELRLGQEVIAIGHPSGLTFTPTRGIINGVHKTSELPGYARQYLSLQNASKDEQWVQTDAVISHGSSGGPLMNRRGDVVGINSWGSEKTRFAFAVHVKHLEELQRSLYDHAVPLSATAQKVGASEEAPGELEERVRALFGEFQQASKDFFVELDLARSHGHTRAELDTIVRRNPSNAFAARFLALGKENRKTKIGLQSYLMACSLLRSADPKTTSGILQETANLLLEDHLDDRDLGQAALLMPALPQSGTKRFLRALIEKSPYREVRAYACCSLAKILQHESDANPGTVSNPAADKEIVALLTRVTDEFADVKVQGHSLVELVKPLLFAKERLAVGMSAPEIEGADVDGTRFKLSDYRGKVVLLEFWGDWSPHCVRLYSYERTLVNKYRERKFALLGVNTDPPNRLAAAEKDKKVTWRSWSDGTPNGPIVKQWAVDSFPLMFLIDHRGTIRMRGSFDPETIEHSVDPLVAEAEGRSRTSRRRDPAGPRALQQQ